MCVCTCACVCVCECVCLHAHMYLCVAPPPDPAMQKVFIRTSALDLVINHMEGGSRGGERASEG